MAASVRQQVDDYVSGIGMLKRPFARMALRSATAPCETVGLHDTPEGLAIACDDRKVAVAPPTGEEVSFHGDDGHDLGLTHTVEADGTVVQVFVSRRGTRTNRFVPLADGGLRMEVTITSGLLGDPLRYQVTYPR
jgi:hypothetical protein